MKIRITEKLLCLPPFLSTTWEQVRYLKLEIDKAGHEVLVICMSDGGIVRLLDINEKLLSAIFEGHLRFLEERAKASVVQHALGHFEQMLAHLKSGILTPENVADLLSHNAEHAGLPPLPKEVLDKITQVAHWITPQEASAMPHPEEGCNCVHCQIARTIQEKVSSTDEMGGEEVKLEELSFRDWIVQEMGDKLYQVTNPDNPQDQYSVFLGSPIGCTCGMKDCEHIKTVLNT